MKKRSAMLLAALLAGPALGANSSELIAQLRAEDWSARQAAEDALVADGPAVIDDLNAALATATDAEIRQRIASAIGRINREQLTSATPVTMHKTFDHPVDALRAVANVAGLSVAVESADVSPLIEAAKPVRIDCENRPLLEALLNVAADGGVAVRLIGEKVVVRGKPANEGRPVMMINGAIALVADLARRSESTDMASGRHSVSTHISVDLYTEPKLRLVTGSVSLVTKSMTDDQNRPVQVRPMNLVFSHLPDGRWNCTIGLMPTDPPPKTLAKLEAEVMAKVVVLTDDLHVDDLSSLPTDLKTASGIINIKSVAQVGGVWTIVLHVPQQQFRPGGLGGGFPQAFQFSDPDVLRITDSHGRWLTMGPPQMAVSQDLEITIPIVLAAPDDPPKAIEIRIPSQTRDLRVPMTLNNLPLP